jgi:glycerol dehydrogenase-like iron-containing ADH family enzyme
MCRYLTILRENELKQVVLICGHNTLHLVHQHTSIRLKRDAFFQLDQMLQSRCLTNSNGPLRCKTSHDGFIELWIGGGDSACSRLS